jgi:hypothetical protein
LDSLKEGDCTEYLGVEERIKFKTDIKGIRWEGVGCFIWLSTGTDGGLL